MLLGKFTYTGNGKTYLLLLFAHSNPLHLLTQLRINPLRKPRFAAPAFYLICRNPAHTAVFIRFYSQRRLCIPLQEEGHIQMQMRGYILTSFSWPSTVRISSENSSSERNFTSVSPLSSCISFLITRLTSSSPSAWPPSQTHER